MQPLHFLAVIPGGVRVFEVQASGGKFLRVSRSTFTVLSRTIVIQAVLIGHYLVNKARVVRAGVSVYERTVQKCNGLVVVRERAAGRRYTLVRLG